MKYVLKHKTSGKYYSNYYDTEVDFEDASITALNYNESGYDFYIVVPYNQEIRNIKLKKLNEIRL